MSARDLLNFLFKWKGTLLTTFLLVVSMATLLVYLLPPMYAGYSKILIERNRAPMMRSSFSGGLEMVEVINNSVEILVSRPVMEKVVDRLKPHEQPSQDSSLKRFIRSTKKFLENIGLISQASRREGWIKELLEQSEVKPVVNSNVLEVQYKHEDPQWAANIVNTMTDAFVEHYLAVYASKGVSAFYKQQMDAIMMRLSARREEMNAFKRTTGISAIDETRKELAHEIGTLRENLNTARNTLQEKQSRFTTGHPELERERKRIRDIESSISRVNQNLLNLEEQEAKLRQLTDFITSEEQTFRDYKKRYDEARLDELSNADLINVRIIQYSKVPEVPARPRIFFILLAIAGGLVLSFLTALIREYFDHRVSDPQAAERLLGAPAIGSIERFGWGRRLTQRLFSF